MKEQIELLSVEQILCVVRRVNGTISEIDEEGWEQNESRKVVFNQSNKSLNILFTWKGVKLASMAHLNRSQIKCNIELEPAYLAAFRWDD